jgi:O-antigen ligase
MYSRDADAAPERDHDQSLARWSARDGPTVPGSQANMTQGGSSKVGIPVRHTGQAGRRIAGWIPACAAAVLFVWAVYDQGAFLDPTKTIVALAMPALGLAHGLLRRYLRHQILPWTPVDRSFLALGLYGALSAAWSIDPVKSLRAAGVLLGSLFFLRLGRDAGRVSTRGRRGLLLGAVVLATTVSLLAIVGYSLPISRLSIVHDGRLMATGTFGYANALAAFLVLSIAATAAYFVDSRGGTKHLLLLLPSAAVQIAALVLSRSRAAAAVVILFAVLFAAIRLLASTTHVWRNRAMGGLLSALVAAAIYYTVSLWFGQFRPWGPMTADVFRVNTWRAALDAAAQRPVAGYGLDTFYQAYAPFKQGAHTTYAHNLFIQQLVENGALGVALLIVFLALVISAPLATLTGRLRNPRIPLLLGALGFVLLNLVDLSWYFPALLFMFSGLAGAMSSYAPK